MTSPRTRSQTAPRASRKGKRIVTAGAAAFVIGGLGLAGGAQWTAHEVRSALAGAGVQVAGVSVDPVSGVVTLDGLAASRDGVNIRVGSVESTGGFALASPAEAASSVTLTDIAISGPGITVRIPRLEASGDNLDEASLRAIFDTNATAPLAQRLSGLRISKATMPELIVEQASGAARSASTWRDVAITDLHDGLAGAVTAASAQVSGKVDKTETKGTLGAARMDQVNLAHIARVYTEAATSDADRKLAPAYGAMSVSDIQISRDAANVSIRSATGKDFQMRLRSKPLIQIMADVEKVKDRKELEPKARAAYFRNIAEILDAFSVGEASANGITFDAPVDDDADGDKAKPAAPQRIRGEIASIGLAGDPARGGLTFTSFKVAPAQGDLISFGSAGLTSFGMGTMAGFFRDQATALEAGKERDDLSPLAMDGDFFLKDLAVDMADDDKPGERIKFSLGAYTGGYRNAAGDKPGSVKASLDNLVIDLPKATPAPSAEDAEDEDSLADTVRKLRAMGYERVDLSAKIDGSWTPATREMRIGEVAFSAAGMGGVRISGLLGDVSKDVFTLDSDKGQEALMDARLKTLSLSVTDGGFADRFAVQQAKEQGMDAAAVRTGWAALAQMLLPSFLGTSDGAKTLASALGGFIRTSNGALDITLTSKKPEGDTISDITLSAMSGAPDKLFGQFDVKASAK